jgi:hypothetical protein
MLSVKEAIVLLMELEAIESIIRVPARVITPNHSCWTFTSNF